MLISILLFVAQFFNILIIAANAPDCIKCFLGVGLFVVEVALNITLIAMYRSSISGMQNTLTLDMFGFAYDNSCTDGPMHRTLRLMLTQYQYEYGLFRSGLGLSLACLLTLFLLIFCASPLREWLFEKLGQALETCLRPICNKKKEPEKKEMVSD
jgi:hypothetical protein